MGYLKQFNKEQKIIISTILSLLLPYYLTAIYFFIISIYIIKNYNQQLLQSKPYSKYLTFFILFISIISILFQNWLGLFVSIILASIFIITLFYYCYTTKKLFEIILDILIFISIIWFIISIYQYIQILNNNGYQNFIIKFFSKRENRVSSIMMNANYYASVLQMIILITIYKIYNTKNIKINIYYITTILLNIFILSLTSSRTAWVSLIVAIFIFFLFNKNKKISFVFISLGLLVCCYFFVNPHLIPRIQYLLSNMDVRINIWQTSINGILSNPISGQGPMTYMMIFENLNGHNTHHAHSIFLDPLLSFGIIGTILLLLFYKQLLINNIKIYKQNRLHSAIVIATITSVLVHGLTDYAIFFIQPGFIFLIILYSYKCFD